MSAAEFGCADIEDRLLAAIADAGLDAGAIAAEDLGALDHFHTGGRRATLELLELASVEARMRVVDVGAGIGGPARLIATTRGCRVDCLEPAPDFCRAARLLNRLTRLEDRVSVHQGSALEMPFADATFDLAWMQNVGMAILNKRRLYAEIARVLRPGGRFVLQEVAAGTGEPYFPVPWAASAATSHLVSPARMLALLAEAGLRKEVFADVSEAELGRPAAGAAPGALTLAVYVEDMATKSGNSRASLEEGRIRLVKGLFRKPQPNAE